MHEIEFSTSTHKAVVCPVSGRIKATAIMEGYTDIVTNVFKPCYNGNISDSFELLVALGKHFVERWRASNENLSIKVTFNGHASFEDIQKLERAQKLLGNCVFCESSGRYVENDVEYIPVIPLVNKKDVVSSVKSICEAFGITEKDFAMPWKWQQKDCENN